MLPDTEPRGMQGRRGSIGTNGTNGTLESVLQVDTPPLSSAGLGEEDFEEVAGPMPDP